jgi:hypothetical protein
MLKGEVHIPLDVNNATTIVLEKIIKPFCQLHEGQAEISLGANSVLILLEESLGDNAIGYINNPLQAL